MSLFSTYSQGENRVTGSILAVFQALSLARMERLLGAIMEQSEFQLVQFQNQPSRDGAGVPDAIILSSSRIFIETKTVRNAVSVDQIERHLKRLEGAAEQNRALILLTPDSAPPSAVREINDESLLWTSFDALDQAIEELLSDAREVVSEREAFLLRELQAFLLEEGLVGSEKDVVVVPARRAWGEYQELHAYVCQPGRTFQPVERIAFYFDGCIQRSVPKILEVHDRVLFEREVHDGHLKHVVETLLDSQSQDRESEQKVFLLTAPDEPETVTLQRPIVNDLVSESGRTAAFTMNQRYVSLEKLQSAKTTSELV